MAGERGSPDTWRDPRGFALKFYSSEGNLDIVGNNTPVFFLRDPMKFQHFIRSQKRGRTTGCETTTCSGTVGRPGVAVDADQPGNGQERLTGDPDTKQVRSHPGPQPLPPSPKMLAEVAVETASSPSVRGKCR